MSLFTYLYKRTNLPSISYLTIMDLNHHTCHEGNKQIQLRQLRSGENVASITYYLEKYGVADPVRINMQCIRFWS